MLWSGSPLASPGGSQGKRLLLQEPHQERCQLCPGRRLLRRQVEAVTIGDTSHQPLGYRPLHRLLGPGGNPAGVGKALQLRPGSRIGHFVTCIAVEDDDDLLPGQLAIRTVLACWAVSDESTSWYEPS